MSTTPPVHPLSHLRSVSAEGLRVRASIWIENRYHDPDDAVKTALQAAAFDIEAAAQTFSTLTAADPEDLSNDREAIMAIIDGTRVTCDPAALLTMAATLRVQGIPNDGGSTATHLEGAAARIAEDAERLRNIRAAAIDFNPERIREIARGATDPDGTNEVPTMRM